MKYKILAIFFATALLLAGCTSQNGNDVSSASGSSEAQESRAASAGASSSAPAPIDSVAFQDALDAVLNLEAGSAGSSLKAVTAAAQLLNFSETCEEEQASSLEAAVKAYFEALNQEQRELFIQNFKAIDQSAQSILTGEEGINGLLEDAGNPQKYDSYSPERYSAVKAAIDETLAQ